MEENLFCCIPQQKIISVMGFKGENLLVVSHNASNAAVLYPTTAKKLKNFNYCEKKFCKQNGFYQ
jgi:hypothetical protein